jgi:adenylate cyclase
MSLLEELKRRNVLRVGAAYLAVSWLLVQIAETIAPAFGLGDAPVRYLVIGLGIGLVPMVVISWAFELTPEGLKRDREVVPGRSIAPRAAKQLDRLFLVALSLALAYFALDKFLLDPARDAAREEALAREVRSEARVESYGEKSIAVLPFVNMSADPEQEYFSDGISEEILNLLAKIPQLRVISRSSAFTFKGKDVTVGQIAEQLNVAHVLEGSVRKSGNRIRITAQLIEARTDTHLWSETYDRSLDDVFAIQDEIGAAVVAQLRVKLLGETPKSRRTDTEAFALVLQARQMLDGGSGEYDRIHTLLAQALAQDPRYVPAWTTLAWVYYRLFRSPRDVDPGHAVPGISTEDADRLSRETLEKALAIDPDDGVALAYMAFRKWALEGDLPAAAPLYMHALRADPGNVDVLRTAGIYARAIDRPELAARLLEFALARDPLCQICRYMLGGAYRQASRYDEAESAFRTFVTMGSGGLASLGMVLLLRGDPSAAQAVFVQLPPDAPLRLQAAAMTAYTLGHEREFRDALADLTEYARDSGDGNNARLLAEAYAWASEADAAFEWFARSQAQEDPVHVYRFFDPVLGGIHADSRWPGLLASRGIAPERLAAIAFDVDLPR